MASCFTCANPNATFSDRQVSFLFRGHQVMFCKDCFRAVWHDINNNIMTARPKTKEIMDRIFLPTVKPT